MKIFLFSIVLVVISSCSRKGLIGDQYVTLSYDQTFCSDAWQNSSTDSLTLRNIAHYFDSVGLYIASLTIKQINAPEACLACTCKNGKVIYLTTFADLKTRYLPYNFK